MTDRAAGIFKNKKVNFAKLTVFGFRQEEDRFIYERNLPETDFRLLVTVTEEGEIKAEIFDTVLNEPYILHLVEGSTGSFVGKIRAQYEDALSEIAECCCEDNVFKTAQSRELIDYVRQAHGDELEFLWKKFPEDAIWRRKDTGKWYAVLLTVSKRKLGFDSDEKAEIIDFRVPPDELRELIDNRVYFPGYHMNKKHWCTIILDGSVSSEEIYGRIEQSYLLAVK